MKTNRISFPIRVMPKYAETFRRKASELNMSQGDFFKYLLKLDDKPNIYPDLLIKINSLVKADDNAEEMEYFKEATGMHELLKDIKENYKVDAVIADIEDQMNHVTSSSFKLNIKMTPPETLVLGNMTWLNLQLKGEIDD